MKILVTSLLLLILRFGFFPACSTLQAEGIRIRPVAIGVSADSLRLTLDMNLDAVHVDRYTAIQFTPILQNKQKRISLAPVIVTGALRYRFERRERTLQSGRTVYIDPYRVLLDKNDNLSKKVTYRVAVPYASWMQGAMLLLRQEIKDCCDLQLLGTDTLTRRLALTATPPGADLAPMTAAHTPASKAVVPLPVAAVHTAPRAHTPVAQLPVVRSATRQAATLPPIVSISEADLATYLSMVSFLRPDNRLKNKSRTQSATLYFDYPLGKDDIYPDYKNNRTEINKIDAIIQPIVSDGYSRISRIRIRGYASPDGDYKVNEKLAANRSRLFAGYVGDAYGLPSALFDISSVAEDWEGLKELLRRNRPPYAEAALNVISRYGVFAGREKQLMDLQGGVPYKEMLRTLFPRLRRIEVVVEYDIRSLAAEEVGEMIYTHPDLLSLSEMYEVARYYRPGTDQYREVYEIAAFHFPDDVTANVNAAAAVMLTGDLQSAWNYLRKAEADPRAWNNLGVLTLMEGDPAGAAVWFRKAVGVEPRKARRNLEIAEAMMNTK